MPLTRDKITIPLATLTPLSRKLFNREILEYQLRLMFMRGPSTYDALRSSIRVNFDIANETIVINGPAFVEGQDGKSRFSEEWDYIFDNFLLKPSFIDAVIQLRFVSVNPVTIYYQLLSSEMKLDLNSLYEVKGMKMRRAVISPPTRTRFPPTRKREVEIPKKKPETQLEAIKLSSVVDGHYQIERTDRDIAGRGNLTSFSEGPVDDSIPAEFEVNVIRDHPAGVLVDVIPGAPFYAFCYRNIYPKMQDINRMIESGMFVVFVEGVENKSMASVEREYEKFFRDWGIPIIDYVTADRLRAAEIELLTRKTGYGDGANSSFRNFYVIQRPVEKFHSSAWAGINTERRRGLVGIPWAKDEFSGMDLASPQPDDGFLSYFVAEGIKRRLQGKETLQVFFPLLAIHTRGEIIRLLTKFENTIREKLNYEFYTKQNTMGVYLRSMGEWILLRAMLRKYL